MSSNHRAFHIDILGQIAVNRKGVDEHPRQAQVEAHVIPCQFKRWGILNSSVGGGTQYYVARFGRATRDMRIGRDPQICICKTSDGSPKHPMLSG